MTKSKKQEIKPNTNWRKKNSKKEVYIFACEDGSVWFHDPDYNETLVWTIERFLKKHEFAV